MSPVVTGAVVKGRGTSRRRIPKVSEALARDLLDDILARRLEPGTMLPPEAHMLAHHRVGRASLREALRILEVHGIIRVKPGPGGGPVVATVTPTEFGRTASLFFQARGATHAQLVEARLLLEPVMARLAAERVNEHTTEVLHGLLERAKGAMEVVGPEWGLASSDFHEAIGQLHGNEVLHLLGTSLATVQDDRMRLEFPLTDRQEVLRVHAVIADAIISGNGEVAERLMRAHLRAISERQKEIFPGVMDEVICWL